MKSKMLKNWMMLVCSSSVTTVMSFFCFTIIGNKMSVDDYGLFSTMIALATTASIFINNIISGTVANREIAVDSSTASTVLKKTFLIRILSFAVVAGVLFFYTGSDERVNKGVFIALIGILAFEAFWELFEQVAFGLKTMKYTTILNISFTALWLCFIFLIKKDFASAVVVLTAYAVINLAKTITYGILVKRKTSTITEKKDVHYLRLFGMSLPYLYLRLLGTVSTQIPILLLDGYSELSQVSYFAVGEKFTTPITKLTMTAISAVFPFLTKALKDNREKATKLISTVLGLILAFGACGSLFLCSTSRFWLVGIMGEKYQNAVEPFNYQIWFTIILSIDTIFSMILSSDFKQKTLALITTIDIVVYLPFLYFGVQNGAKGLAIARLAAAGLCMCYHLCVISYICKKSVFKNYSLLVNAAIFILLLACSRLSIESSIKLIISIAFLAISFLINKNQIFGLFTMVREKKTDDSKTEKL